MKRHHLQGILSITATFLFSCSSPALKAPAPILSAFLGRNPALKDERKLSPFALSGGSLVTTKQNIYIAPVSLSYLRDASKSLAKDGSNSDSRIRASGELAEYTHTRFIEAFQRSPKPRYQVQTTPSGDCLTLELALTELNRNCATGAVTRFALNAVTVPGMDAVLVKTTRGLKGSIAIEGKVRVGVGGRVIYQFADNEESRSAFILPITDFTPYGQAREAIRAWAKQFEELTRTEPGKRVKGTGVISLF